MPTAYYPVDGTYKAWTPDMVGLGNVDNTADSAKSVKYATSAGSATTASSAATATKASGIVDYNNASNIIQIGWSGDGLTASQLAYGLGYTNDKKIKDVSKAEYQKWLGLGSAAYTASSAYSAANHSHSQYAPNDMVVVSDTQPTSSTCKIWIKA